MDELYQTAIHEAGHAVMAVILGRKIQYVTIEADDSRLGFCLYADNVPMNESDFERGCRIQAEAMSLIAGTTAEAVLLGVSPMDSRGKEDYEEVEKILAAPNDGKTKERDDYIHARAYSIIGNHLVKQGIKAIADALIKRKTLLGEEIQQIMKSIEEKHKN